MPIINVQDLTPRTGFAILGNRRAGLLGSSVAGAGDVNKDGFSDVIVGEPGVQSRAYVIFGKASGHSAVDTGALGSAGFTIFGEAAPGNAATNNVGTSVAGVGDYNNDGFADVAVSGAYLIYGRAAPGDVDVLSLGGSGLSLGAGVRVAGGGDFNRDGRGDLLVNLEASDATTTTLFLGGDLGASTITAQGTIGNTPTAAFGDFNGDGLSDVAIGVDVGDTAVRVRFGLPGGNISEAAELARPNSNPTTEVVGAADINFDGFDDLLLGSEDFQEVNGRVAVALGGPAFDLVPEFSFFGADGDQAGLSVSGAGDVNGDGIKDIIIGAPGISGPGKAYVIYGRTGGFSDFNLGTLAGNPNLGFVIQGTSSSRLGFSVGAAGDVNGDGLDDIIVGARLGDDTKGAAYVIFGFRTGAQPTPLPGTPGDDILFDTPGNDAITADGGNDQITITSGSDSVDGGSGSDALRVAWSAVTNGVTFAAAAGAEGFGGVITDGTSSYRGEISGIERFVIATGTGNDTIATDGGNDEIDVAGGTNSVDAGAGDDRITLSGSGTVKGGAGTDTLIINYSGAAGAVANTVALTTDPDGGFQGRFQVGTTARFVDFTGIEKFEITTGSSADNLVTGSGDDVVRSGSGNDRVDVGRGVDTADGGDGTDTLSADFSDDPTGVSIDLRNAVNAGAFGSFSNFEIYGTIIGSGHDDSFLAGREATAVATTFNLGAGNDRAAVSNGSDTVNGGTGNDTLIIDYGDSTGIVSTTIGLTANADGGFDGRIQVGSTSRFVGFTGIENFEIDAGSGADTITTASGNDVVRSGAGNDRVNVGSGVNVVDGGNGFDTLSADFSAATAGVSLDFRNQVSSGAFGSFTDLEAFGTVTGSAFDDSFLAGRETLAVNTTFNLGAGNDRAAVSDGTDTVNGGTGSDTLVVDYSNASAIVSTTVALTPNAEGGFNGRVQVGTTSRLVDFTGIENFSVTTGTGNDNVTLGSGNDSLFLQRGGGDIGRTGGGDDELYFGAAFGTGDVADGGGGSDQLTLQGEYGAGVILTGTNFIDIETVALLSAADTRLLSPAVPGDLAFVGVNGSAVIGNGGQAAVLVRNGLAAGDGFYITDGAFLSATGDASTTFRTGEGYVRYTAPAGGIPAGSVLVFDFRPDGPSVSRNGGGAAGTVENVPNGSGTSRGVEIGIGGDQLTIFTTIDASPLSGTPTLLAFVDFGFNPFQNGSAETTNIPTIANGQVLNLPSYATSLIFSDAANVASQSIAALNDPANYSTRLNDNAQPYDQGALQSDAGHSYNLTIANDVLAAGELLTINANALGAGESFLLNGAGETDGGAFLLLAGFGATTLTGGSGNDSFVFGEGRFQAGSDSVDGGGGTDNQFLLSGNHTIQFAANSLTNIQTLVLVSSADPRFGQVGADFEYNLTMADANVASGTTLIVTAAALEANERLVFSGANETNGRFDVRGGAGSDILSGGGGADELFGGEGADTLNGAEDGSVDTLRGGRGDDLYLIEDADDVVVELAGEGTDEIRTSLTDHTIALNVEKLTYTGTAAASVRGNAQNNVLTGGATGDLLFLQAGGEDNAVGGGGDDGFYFGAALSAGDIVDGGEGTLDTVGLEGNYGTFGAGATPFIILASHLTNVELLALLPGSDARFDQSAASLFSYNLAVTNDTLAAGRQLVVTFNTLAVGENVTFDGSQESDGSFFFYGGRGNDVLTGGGQNDAFYFGTDRFGPGDVVRGGAGDMDQLGLQGDYAGARAVTFGESQIEGVEFLVLMTARDARFAGMADAAYNYDITMADGNVAAGATLVVSANMLLATETLVFRGGAETNGRFMIFSGDGADTLTGGRGADEISGRGGADRITGGLGGDTLRGGDGGDTFAYTATTDSTADAVDQILDFGQDDRIDLSLIDANSLNGSGDDAFRFIGGAAFSGGGAAGAGELRAVNNNGVWSIEGDTNGDTVADLIILVTTTDPLFAVGAGSFVP